MWARNLQRLRTVPQSFCQKRNAWVLKRVYPPKRLPENASQEEVDQTVFTEDYKHMRYEVVEETDLEPSNISVLILRSSEEFGRRGQIKSINGRLARQELLLPGFGVYASPYNLEKYKDIILPEDSVQYSSDSASKNINEMTKLVVPVVMNKNKKWTLEKWHIKMALLRQGVLVEDDCIILPETVSGPNEELEGGELLVAIKVNDFETVKIRAVIFHKYELDTSEIPPKGWEHRFYKPIFSSQSEELKMLPRHPLHAEVVADLLDASKIMQDFSNWKSARDKKLFG